MKPYRVSDKNKPNINSFVDGPWSREPNEAEWETYDLPL